MKTNPPGEGVEARLCGVLPPLVTPFKTDGSLDLAAFEANLDAYAGADLAGYLVLGSNGEAATLETEEKLVLVQSARRLSRGRLLLVGTGVESTRGTIDLTRRVADLGADGVLVLTPHYYRAQMTTDVLQRYFEAVADASPVPVYIYSVPVFTGIHFPLELAVKLAAHPNVRGMKESSGDVALLGRIVASVPSTFAVACGSAPVLYPALCQGAVAAVLAVACAVPALPAAVFRAHAAGDHPRARTLQQVLTPLAVAVTATYGVAGLKAALDAAGLRGGLVRAPLTLISDAGRTVVTSLIKDAQAALR